MIYVLTVAATSTLGYVSPDRVDYAREVLTTGIKYAAVVQHYSRLTLNTLFTVVHIKTRTLITVHLHRSQNIVVSVIIVSMIVIIDIIVIIGKLYFRIVNVININ